MKITLQIISFLLIFAGFLPLIKRDYWTFRVFDYPRMQKLTLTLTLLFLWLSIFYNQLEIFDWIIVSGLVILGLYLFWQIFPFTPLSKKMIKDAKSDEPIAIKVYVSNVYQFNTDFKKTISLIEKEKPDIFLLVETDQKWADAIEIFKEDYPYHIEKPLDNTYGMLFYSKLPIKKQQLLYLIDDEIPSLELDLELRDGNLVKLYAIHPTPPVPGENESSTERDAEILIVGKKAKAYGKPCLVIGDLNDVGWSYTSELFLKISGLLDPRRGRGMFSTFHAKYFFLRWPLDHIFVSKDFTLKKITVHKNIGSDHFPISTSLVLDPANLNEEKSADADEKEEAEEKISNGKEA